jgi:hypothetical protein
MKSGVRNTKVPKLKRSSENFRRKPDLFLIL